jgi:hypothetical protein
MLIVAGCSTNGGFSGTGTTIGQHDGATATLLADGRVLVMGGQHRAGSPVIEIYDPKSGSFSQTGSMITSRLFGYAATLLHNGLVLVAGGAGSEVSPSLASAELFDPKTGIFSATGSMAVARSGQVASILSDGRVLLVGGLDSHSNATAEIYDPTTGTFVFTGSPDVRFVEPASATLLANGDVLVSNGQFAQVYDPNSGTFADTGAPVATRGQETETKLADGRVLVAGGGGGSTGGSLASAELYDPATGKFSPTGSMIVARTRQTATLLANGRVLIAGGIGSDGSVLSAAEIYDPKTGTFAPAGSLAQARVDHAAVLLNDGRVLIAGGRSSTNYVPIEHDNYLLNSAELFTP